MAMVQTETNPQQPEKNTKCPTSKTTKTKVTVITTSDRKWTLDTTRHPKTRPCRECWIYIRQ